MIGGNKHIQIKHRFFSRVFLRAKDRLRPNGLRRVEAGFSLIEVLISVVLFSMIILSATEIFKLVIDGQRSALASQNVQESLKYFFEVMDKEMRMAHKNNGICSGIEDDQIFAVTANSYGDVLRFKNRYGECIEYALALDGENQRFKITRGVNSAYISPSKIRVNNLHFILNNTAGTQPMVTVNFQAWALDEAQFKSEMKIQTTITSRYYK